MGKEQGAATVTGSRWVTVTAGPERSRRTTQGVQEAEWMGVGVGRLGMQRKGE